MGPGGAVAPPQEGPEAARGQHRVQARARLTGAEGLPRARRLARSADIRRCLARGRRRRYAFLEMIWMDNGLGHPRFGMIVPRHRQTAVARNRLRRRLREVWRREVQAHQPAWDLLVRARREAYGASFDQLRAELVAWRDATCPAG